MKPLSKLQLNSINKERSDRLAVLKLPNDEINDELFSQVSMLKSVDRAQVLGAWDYAKSLDYHHEGQSKQVYLAHPVRVAMLFNILVTPPYVVGIKTSLLHNVLEVGDISYGKLVHDVGGEVAKAIKILTVDRAVQWDWQYKDKYYDEISNGKKFIKQVKIIDKLDNLFLLCLNSNDEIREKYLYEIERWILPLTENVFPDIVSYVEELIEDNRRVGYVSLDSF